MAVRAYMSALHQAWLYGYDAAYERWRNLAPADQQFVDGLRKAWMAYTNREQWAASLSTAAMNVQFLNVALRRRANPSNPLQWLGSLGPVGVPPARPRGLFGFFAKSTPRPPLGPQWEMIGTGFSAPNWSLIVESWRTIVPGFGRMIQDVAEEVGDPMPTSLDQPAGLAWLDRAMRWPQAPDEEQLRALVALSHDEQHELASTLLTQYSAWLDKSLVAKGGCGHTIDNVIPKTLANLACFCGPLDTDLLRRAWDLGLRYNRGIFRMDVAGPEMRAIVGASLPAGMEEWVEICRSPHLSAGVTLVEAETLPSDQPSIRAGYVDRLSLAGKTLLVLLDIDLTKPDVQFLELAGTRLRICGSAQPVGEPLFTRVDTNGGVAFLDEAVDVPEPDEPPDARPKQFVTGRALFAPFEGLRDAGYLGSSSRAGGIPDWEQYPEVPTSPVSGDPMTFIAQFPHPVYGTAYVFLDYDNMVAGVLTQVD